MIVRHYLNPLKLKQVDTLVLGCTHYPLLADVIQRAVGPSVTLVDSADTAASEVKSVLENLGLTSFIATTVVLTWTDSVTPYIIIPIITLDTTNDIEANDDNIIETIETIVPIVFPIVSAKSNSSIWSSSSNPIL